MRDVEFFEELLVCRRLFQGIELGAVDVLQQRVAQQVVIGGIPHDRRDGRQPCLLGGPPPALPHHQLVARPRSVGRLPNHDRLHQAEFADRVDQLGERLFIEYLPGLARVGLDRRGIELAVDRAHTGALGGHTADHNIRRGVTESGAAVGRTGRDQRCQAAAEAALASDWLCHDCASKDDRCASSRLASR